MRRKLLIIGAASLVAVAVAATLLVFRMGDDENPNVQRGRELLSVDEPEAAAREFKIALKQNPNDERAKALLLVAVERKEKALVTWYQLQQGFAQLQRVIDDSKFASLESIKHLRKFAVGTRQEMYEKGVDTKNADELARITRVAAKFSFDTGDGDEKDAAAFVLALQGNANAMNHLVDRLKSDKATLVPELLMKLGDNVERPLVTVAADKDNLGRAKALDVLVKVREKQAAKHWFEASSELRGIKPEDLPKELQAFVGYFDTNGLTREQLEYGFSIHEDVPSLNSIAAFVNDDGSRRVLVLQGFAPSTKQVVTRPVLIDDGALTELSLQASPELMKKLAAEGPITSVSYDGSSKRLQLTQLGLGQVKAMKEVPKASYQRGDRVRVRAIGKDGTIAGVDEFGLVLVELDDEHRGVKQMSLTPGAVRFLEPYLVQQVVNRNFEGALDVAKRSLTLTAIAEGFEEPADLHLQGVRVDKRCVDNPLSKGCQ
jgi:hypothetical protein